MENENKIIHMNNNQMLLFCELLQEEYNKKEKKTNESRINIGNVLNKVFENE